VGKGGGGGGKDQEHSKEQSQEQSQKASEGHNNQILTEIRKTVQDSCSYGATSNKGRGGN
jgi:hypothetical protein